MPLVRYWVGDLAAATRAPCACGRPGLRLTRLHGRADDALLLPSGERVLPSTIILGFRGVEGVAQFQVSQRSADRLEVRVVLADAGAPAARTIDQVRRNLVEATRGQLQVEVAVVDAIERAVGGKLKSVCCALAPPPR
jgi:phenylacetate-CoA ligase